MNTSETIKETRLQTAINSESAQPTKKAFLVEEVLPEDRAGLEQRLAELGGELADCQNRIRELSAAEKPAEDIFFAQEIHAARQEKLVLEFKKELCRVRLNRLNLE